MVADFVLNLKIKLRAEAIEQMLVATPIVEMLQLHLTLHNGRTYSNIATCLKQETMLSAHPSMKTTGSVWIHFRNE